MNTNSTLADAIDRQNETGEEFCVQCAQGMGFSAMRTHIDDPLRFKDGAYYTEGAGQTCATCAQKSPQSEKSD